MTQDEAAKWLQQVDGQIFRTPPSAGRRDAWVAVVTIPRDQLTHRQRPHRAVERGKLIVALGGSMEEATVAAEQRWRSLFESAQGAH